MKYQALQLALAAALVAATSGCILVGADPSPGPGAKAGHDVVICHKGNKTMTLPREAAEAHMGHGDRYGSC
jgi:hypothetical protein